MVPLNDDELARYARHIVLREIGGAGQTRLAAATVVVIGCGGIGSPAIQYLAASGIGTLRLVDDDRIDLSNLQRQTIFGSAELGRGKAAVAAERVAALNPHVTVQPVAIRADRGNIAQVLAAADAVIDGCDNFETRLVVADAALAARVSLVSAAVGQFEGQLGVFRGWERGRPCYRCFVGDAPARDAGSCAEDGVLGPVTGILGSMAALEAIRAVAPFGIDPTGMMVLIDTLALRFRSVRLPKDPGCRSCGG